MYHYYRVGGPPKVYCKFPGTLVETIASAGSPGES